MRKVDREEERTRERERNTNNVALIKPLNNVYTYMIRIKRVNQSNVDFGLQK